MSSPKKNMKISTKMLHGDSEYTDDHIGPAIAVSSTYRYPDLSSGEWRRVDEGWDAFRPDRSYYSRYTVSTSTRAEKLLGELHGGHAVIYSSGLTAGFSALLHIQPKRIALKGGYFGFHNTIRIYCKINPAVKLIDLDDDLREGDLVWLETPLNPTGEVRDIAYYAKKAHSVGAKLGIDATFAPPPLQDPFKWGADIIMHSATKYFGGHSDLLAGVLVVKTEEQWRDLWHSRTYLGNNAGSLESWLLLRSLRTFPLRISAQSKNATQLATWLNEIARTPKGKSYDGVPGGLIKTVWHGSLQSKKGFDPSKQHEGGYSPCFSILVENPKHGQLIPAKLKLFTHATSLGGVESLIEQRRHSDETADFGLLRISVGIEDIEDLRNDFRQALQEVAKERAKL